MQSLDLGKEWGNEPHVYKRPLTEDEAYVHRHPPLITEHCLSSPDLKDL